MDRILSQAVLCKRSLYNLIIINKTCLRVYSRCASTLFDVSFEPSGHMLFPCGIVKGILNLKVIAIIAGILKVVRTLHFAYIGSLFANFTLSIGEKHGGI